MLRYILVSIGSGILFGVLDAVINANPLAQKVLGYLKPIARTQVNAIGGTIIDLIYGFAMAGIFILLYKSLPGANGILKGISFGVMAWFFRVIMYVATQWVTTTAPVSALIYITLTGLAEMLILGIFYGLLLKA
ncbi:hypothetical protein ACFL6D_02110 [Spirochaetota bacterium]